MFTNARLFTILKFINARYDCISNHVKTMKSLNLKNVVLKVKKRKIVVIHIAWHKLQTLLA